MTTIPQQLREIAVDVGQQNMAAYVKLRTIAAELEVPAADAVPVVGYLFSRPGISKIDVAPHGGDWEKLIRQRDHLATVSALQARIKDLETQLKTRSQKLREAGYTRRPSAKTLPPDE